MRPEVLAGFGDQLHAPAHGELHGGPTNHPGLLRVRLERSEEGGHLQTQDLEVTQAPQRRQVSEVLVREDRVLAPCVAGDHDPASTPTAAASCSIERAFDVHHLVWGVERRMKLGREGGCDLRLHIPQVGGVIAESVHHGPDHVALQHRGDLLQDGPLLFVSPDMRRFEHVPPQRCPSAVGDVALAHQHVQLVHLLFQLDVVREQVRDDAADLADGESPHATTGQHASTTHPILRGGLRRDVPVADASEGHDRPIQREAVHAPWRLVHPICAVLCCPQCAQPSRLGWIGDCTVHGDEPPCACHQVGQHEDEEQHIHQRQRSIIEASSYPPLAGDLPNLCNAQQATQSNNADTTDVLPG
mmetsp:Transcript_8189/g.23389  ORF Transcript_8189/g.23389 Transcript_8189/m.23389 type:complete len:358 (-) Transcript_8189:585-1658(-)